MKKITRKEFFDKTGEYPEDVIGQDWENEVEEWLEDNGFNSDDGV